MDARTGPDRSPEVDAYLAALPEPARGRIEALRAVVREEAPAAVERIAYGMPTWHQGENLLHLAGFARHVGLYPGAAAVAHFADDLAGYKTSKGAVQLPHDAPLPTALVRRIARWRVAQVSTGVPEALAAALDAHAGARAAWDALSVSCRREYATWIAGAKRAETRDARVAKAIPRIVAGERMKG